MSCQKTAINVGASSGLLEAIGGVARVVQSLYGPNKVRKQVTDEFDKTLFSIDAYTVVSVLQSMNAGTAILQQALDEQQRAFGTGCTTMANLCGRLAEAVRQLQRRGLPTNIIQEALLTVEACCYETAKHMRLALAEVIPSFFDLTWSHQVTALGRLLATKNTMATSLAIEVASALEPIQFCDAKSVSLHNLVTTHVVLGGVTSASSSKVLQGLLLPIAQASLRESIQRRFSTATDATITIDGGVAIIAGDLETTAFTTDTSVQILFVHGEISAKAIDASTSIPNAAICVPVQSYDSLLHLAEMSGAEIVDSWEELLFSAIGHECLHLKALDVSVSKTQHDDHEDEVPTFFLQIVLPSARFQPHMSVVIQGPTESLAVELQNETRKVLRRLSNALRSGYVLPGNGGFWCACAAVIAQEAETLTKSKLESQSAATIDLADSLLELSVFLLENSGECNSNDDGHGAFFSRLARVRSVQKRFARSIQDVGSATFLSRYFDFRSTEYIVLLSETTEAESEDVQCFHVDEYESTSSVIQKGFRLIQLVLNIDRYHVN